MAFLGLITRQSNEALPLEVSYERVLNGRTGTVGTPVVTATSGITVGTPVVSGSYAYIPLTGGTSGTYYALEITAVLSFGGGVTETVQDEVLVLVQDIVASAEPSSWMGGVMELEDALPRILPYVNGCPDVTALYHLRQAAIRFFQRTLAWREDLAPVATVADQATYVIPTPASSAVARLLGVALDGGEAHTVSADMGRRLQLHTSGVDAAWTMDRSVFTIHPTPGEAGKDMVLRVALKPTQDALQIPGALYEHHIAALCDGALAGILNLPRQTFTDHQLATQFQTRFDHAMATAAAAAARSTSRAPLRVKPFPF